MTDQDRQAWDQVSADMLATARTDDASSAIVALTSMTEPKKIEIFLAVNEAGESAMSWENQPDAVTELENNYGYQAIRVVTLIVTIDAPTVETVDVAVPAETKSPVQITIS